MKVILKQNIKGIGQKYEIKNVSDGYANNFLIPKKLAEYASPEAVKKYEAQKVFDEAEKKIKENLLEKQIEDWKQIREKIVSQIEMANELRETNNSLLSTKQNEIMKQLAAIGMVILPLTIIGQLFGLSIHKFPLVDSPYAFWMILGIMATVMVISLIFAKIKKWM